MSNRNRDAGHKYELTIMKELKPTFPDILTSRNESRSLDAKKVDFCYTGKFYFQCKTQKVMPPLSILDEMPEGKINVIIWGKTSKRVKNFVKENDYVILKFDDFKKLL